MTPEQWIALVASIGTCMSALATFLTVRQIAKQREASYQPALAFSDAQFEGGADPKQSSELPRKWTSKAFDSTTQQIEEFYLPLRNIGLGTARAITLTWDFDLLKTVDKANQLAQRTLTPAYFRTDSKDVSIESKNLGNGVSLWENQKVVLIDFVLPAAVEKQPPQLGFLTPILKCAQPLPISSLKTKKTSTHLNYPLCAEFSFQDIGDTHHSATFDIKVRLETRSGGGTRMTGYVESTKRA